MNIILCIIDTLRYDYLHVHGKNNWIQTPNLDRLAAKSLVFDHAYAASYPTIPHRTDVMTGEYAWPGRGPFHPWMPLPFDIQPLPRRLAEAGYATQLIHDTPHLVNGGHAFDWPFAAWTFLRGAEVDRPWIDDAVIRDEAVLPLLPNWGHDPLFDDIDLDQLRTERGLRRLLLTYTRANRKRQQPEDWNAAQVFLKAAEFLRDNACRGSKVCQKEASQGEFFLWLDCFDPHEPWDAPPDFVTLYDQTPGYDGRIDPRAFLRAARRPKDGIFPPGVRERQIALYAAKVTWMDHWLGKLLDALEETGLAQNTAVVLTADHGTNLGERGGFGKTGTVNEQEAHVPLWIHVPQGETGRRDDLAQPQDITATLLGLAGVSPPPGQAGQDLLAGPTSRQFALGGPSVNSWNGDRDQVVFTVFDRNGYLNVTANPGACRLFRYGSVQDTAAQEPVLAQRLHEAGLEEAAQRGLDPRLLDWLYGGGEQPFPTECTAWRGPQKWQLYWERVYEE